MSCNRFPFNSIFITENRKKVTGGRVRWIEAVALVGSLVKTFWTRLDKWMEGVVLVQLPVISLPWCSSLAPHRITQPTENFNIALLVNSLTFWCIRMVIKENCEYHFHLSSNLVSHFWPQRPWSLPLWWMDFCFWVISVDPRFITSSYCLHEVCVFISILQQISGRCKASLFLLDCQQFGTDFTETCLIPESFVRMDCTEPNESRNSSWSSLIVILQLSSVAEYTLSIISWFLLVEGLPVRSSLSTDVRPSLNGLNHLTCVWSVALFSQKPSESYHRFLSMSAQVSGKTWCRCTAQLSWSLSVQHTWLKQQQVLTDC